MEGIFSVIGTSIALIALIFQLLDYRRKKREESVATQDQNANIFELSSGTLNTAQIAALRRALGKHFDESELQNLCFDLNVKYENLPGDNKADKDRELIEYMQRHSRIPELVKRCQQLRPQVSWPILLQTVKTLPSNYETPRIPHNLPRRPKFVGRKFEKVAVLEALRSGDYLVSIEGIGGIGKSSLAKEVAHICLEASQSTRLDKDNINFDGFVWTPENEQKNQQLTLNDLIDTVARTLNYPGVAQLPQEAKLREVRKLLQAKSYLLIVDNFETIEDDSILAFLHNLPASSKGLITTRERNLPNAYVIPLHELKKEDAFELVREESKRLGLQGVEIATEETLSPLYEATGGAPLAIKWATGQIGQKGQSLETVIGYLKNAEADIFERIFARSWNLLASTAQDVLVVMPFFAAPAFRSGIEALSEIHGPEFDEALGQLVEMSLVEANGELDPRYSLHPLTRAFAEVEGKKTRKWEEYDIWQRFLSYYLSFVKNHHTVPARELSAQLEYELPNILLAFDLGEKLKKWGQIIELLELMSGFLDRGQYWSDRVDLNERALEAARQLDDHKVISQIAIYHQGWTLLLQGKYQEAKSLIQEGLSIAEEHNYPIQTALALRNLAVIALEEKDYSRAEINCQRSLQIWENLTENSNKIDPRKGKAITLGTLGNTFWQRKRYRQAQKCYLDQNTVYKELEDPYGLSLTCANLAVCAVKLGRPLQALRYCQNALGHFEEMGREDGPGYLLRWLHHQLHHKSEFPERRASLLDRSQSFVNYGRTRIKTLIYYLVYATRFTLVPEKIKMAKNESPL